VVGTCVENCEHGFAFRLDGYTVVMYGLIDIYVCRLGGTNLELGRVKWYRSWHLRVN
jgi:hypothetical protein